MAGHRRTADAPAGGGRADAPAGGGQAGAMLRMGIHHMLTLWGKGGYGGSPNAEAGEMYQHYYLLHSYPNTCIHDYIYRASLYK